MIRVRVPRRNPPQSAKNLDHPAEASWNVNGHDEACMITGLWSLASPCSTIISIFRRPHEEHRDPARAVSRPEGLDATIAESIYRYDGNILHFEQHQAGEERYYLARVEFDLNGFRLDLRDFDGAFGPVAHKFGMNWVLALSDRRPRVVIFVSKYDHVR